MGLNNYRDEVNGFLSRIADKPVPVSQIIGMLDEEVILLKGSLDDRERLSHQLYDVLFLLFEIAAVRNLDLDSEWIAGRKKKQTKYL